MNDYDGLCEDLLQMARRAQFHATWSLLMRDDSRARKLLEFAGECQEFRHGLFLKGHGYGGY